MSFGRPSILATTVPSGPITHRWTTFNDISRFVMPGIGCTSAPLSNAIEKTAFTS